MTVPLVINLCHWYHLRLALPESRARPRNTKPESSRSKARIKMQRKQEFTNSGAKLQTILQTKITTLQHYRGVFYDHSITRAAHRWTARVIERPPSDETKPCYRGATDMSSIPAMSDQYSCCPSTLSCANIIIKRPNRKICENCFKISKKCDVERFGLGGLGEIVYLCTPKDKRRRNCKYETSRRR